MTNVVERRAESSRGFDASRLRRHAPRNEMLDAVRDQRLELVVDLASRRRRSERREPEEVSHPWAKIEAHRFERSYFAVLEVRIVTTASRWSTSRLDSSLR